MPGISKTDVSVDLARDQQSVDLTPVVVAYGDRNRELGATERGIEDDFDLPLASGRHICPGHETGGRAAAAGLDLLNTDFFTASVDESHRAGLALSVGNRAEVYPARGELQHLVDPIDPFGCVAGGFGR